MNKPRLPSSLIPHPSWYSGSLLISKRSSILSLAKGYTNHVSETDLYSIYVDTLFSSHGRRSNFHGPWLTESARYLRWARLQDLHLFPCSISFHAAGMALDGSGRSFRASWRHNHFSRFLNANRRIFDRVRNAHCRYWRPLAQLLCE